MRTLILALLLVGFTGLAYAGCQTDFGCSNSCLMQGGYYPEKIMQCRQMCTYCN